MFDGIFQPTHLIIILVIALVIFGPSKLGELGGALGRSVREFKQSVNDDETASPVETKTTEAPVVEKTDKPAA